MSGRKPIAEAPGRQAVTDLYARGFCPRCLLGDVPGGEELAAKLGEWLAVIPDGQRADDETVRARLAACRECPHLADGLCGLCGCYVELRAARRSQRCPDLPPRWESI